MRVSSLRTGRTFRISEEVAFHTTTRFRDKVPVTVYKNPTHAEWREIARHSHAKPHVSPGYSPPHKAEYRVLLHRKSGDLYAWPANAMFHNHVRHELGRPQFDDGWEPEFDHDTGVMKKDGTIASDYHNSPFGKWLRDRQAAVAEAKRSLRTLS